MSEKRTVYAVSQGSYSDYHVIALFETEADAEAFRAARHAEDSSSGLIQVFVAECIDREAAIKSTMDRAAPSRTSRGDASPRGAT